MVIIPTEKRFDWKHSPVCLFFIVLVNILIFFFYQSGDGEKFGRAVTSYNSIGYFSTEWPVFKKYLESKNETRLLAEYNDIYQQGDYAQLSYHLLSNNDFFEYLKVNRDKTINLKQIGHWRQREAIQKEIQSMSNLAYGVRPDQLDPVTLITHQFLHGGVGHLLGNMFFLIVCGFAVEAAIGHFRFLIFYLISGIAGGLLYAIINKTSPVSLVGASGSISGVMAMYLGVFRLKKIEFFYWFFIFVGYFRAPALLLLPFYIGNELYSYFTNVDSNVAFMAHTGGFIAGSLLILVSLLLHLKVVNEDYVEEDQKIDPGQEKLARIYDHIEKFQFDAALKAVNIVIAEQGATFDLLYLRYSLLKIEKKGDYQKSLMDLFTMEKISPPQLKKIEQVWLDNPDQHQYLNEDETLKLGWRLSSLPDIRTSENLFSILYANEKKHPSLGFFARKLSVVYEGLDNKAKKNKYEKIADSLL
ncbi:rhomboid family intramembrane serine protease [Motiliproteus sp. MSK22-1]|uniref:rhomboid family intramembrane serine protease n=1 Tax=Motiliproteus sp. MSK22-1 TaxID=1897630 RepID=UPI00097813C3|nr:rhomboid family intramembrane serine protease [Motiliproteus sp. MSK22-1]OMH26605.1 hypothetical protein BGP75_23185 [Motiliproteus sp. MSK22-1]